MGVVRENVVECNTILTDFHNFQAEALLHQTILIVDTKHQFLTMLYIDGVLLAAVFGVNGVVGAIIENHAVLEYLAHSSTLMIIGCF